MGPIRCRPFPLPVPHYSRPASAPPLIEPDVQIYRIQLSEKTHAIAIAIACDAVCNFCKKFRPVSVSIKDFVRKLPRIHVQ
jgi:hypothetical protein